MKKSLLAVLTALILVAGSGSVAAHPHPDVQLYDLKTRELLSESQSIQRLSEARMVLVGEHHDNTAHHQAQLKVIETLHKAGRKVVVGLEMFRKDSQLALDQWIGGQTSEKAFKPIYLNNWNFEWELYGPIFNYARENRIPMVGLNVSRKITAQVAYKGFDSLDEDQRGSLEGITCNVTQEYRDFIGRAYGAHGHGNMNFERFCEAQLVWDTAMAVYAIEYLKDHPDSAMVILAGSGHVRKLGIPAQLDKRVSWPYAVVLPETKGILDPMSITADDADYILIDAYD